MKISLYFISLEDSRAVVKIPLKCAWLVQTAATIAGLYAHIPTGTLPFGIEPMRWIET
jgi:hypothetical protein